ncbi:hypothetical protein L1987_48391 [Smallanthus sonchifolius]|uniref:Uncharacterized protein n=1 Tax=Smallanthus sonchifolius TaxID=185202 RepID=A0ACB9FSS4_9ASTR|nr:hypothetical protein L1987_48391 [Smallanthus sonchifolius]
MQAQEPPKHCEWFVEYQELKRPPVGWKYDKEHSLFIVRRYKGGVEQFKSSHDFSSLPKYDLRALAKLPLQNPGNVGIAKDFEIFLRNQTFNDFRSMTTAKSRRVISKTRIHPRTQRPWNFRKWFYNSTIRSEVIECEGMEDINIFEPMELLNFQLEDLEVLFNNPIKIFSDDDEADAKAYQTVVTIIAKPHFQKPSQAPTA